MSASGLVCAHCLSRAPLEGWLEEGERVFCCHGCKTAYAILMGAGLGDFYERRRWAQEGLSEGAYTWDINEEDLLRAVTPVEGGLELRLLVDGVRCSSCVWVIEQLLSRHPGVTRARVGFSTRVLSVRFDPALTSASEVLRVVEDIGYTGRPFEYGASEEAARRERRSLLFRFGTGAFLSMQLMGAAIGLYGGYLKGMDDASHDYLGWFSLAMATPVVFYCGFPFFRGALRSLINRSPDMDLLVGVGVGAAYSYSVWALFNSREVYFDSAAAIVVFLLLGRLAEAGARERSLHSITRLMRLRPERCRRVTADGGVETVGVERLSVGEVVLVAPGERFPADGKIIEGASEVDESALTGEPYPVARLTGEGVLSGTTNLVAAVKVEVSAVGEGSYISRIQHLVEEALSRKPGLERLADLVASRFVPVVVLLCFFAFGLAVLQGEALGEALLRAVAVLVVACPCALGLATPLAVMGAAGRGAEIGVIFRGGDVIEALAKVDLAAFDKTGTLTVGRPRVVEVTPVGVDKEEVIRLAALAESGSRHPIARGVAAQAAAWGVGGGVSVSRAIPGRGIEAETQEGSILVGSLLFLKEAGVEAGQGFEAPVDGIEVYVAREGLLVGRIFLKDEVRPNARRMLDELAALGVGRAVLSGDRPEPVERFGAALGVATALGGLVPEGKARWVEARKAEGRVVLMAGDGINDAGALAAADVGCAFAGATDVALDLSDLVLLRPEPLSLVRSVRLARATVRIIRQNLFWAFGYNLIALFLAVAGYLAPLWAALAMAASSIIVVANSLRLASAARE